jgi:hypothetical protein
MTVDKGFNMLGLPASVDADRNELHAIGCQFPFMYVTYIVKGLQAFVVVGPEKEQDHWDPFFR